MTVAEFFTIVRKWCRLPAWILLPLSMMNGYTIPACILVTLLVLTNKGSIQRYKDAEKVFDS